MGRFQIRTTAKGGTALPDCACSSVVIRAKEGNLDNIWIGGVDDDVPQVNVGMPLHEDESIILYVDNTNKVRLVAASDYDEVYVIAYLDSDSDIDVDPANPDPPDLTAPTVVSRFPSPGATGIATNTAIYAIFDEELEDASITTTNITVTSTPSITYTVAKDSVDPTKVLIIPDTALAFSKTYTITLTTGLTDDAEDLNPLAAPVSWSFTTAAAPPPADTTAPTIVSVTPANGTTNVAINVNPAVAFSEDMLDSSITATTMKLIKVSNSQEITTSRSHSSDGKTITLIPTSSLEYSTQYNIFIEGGPPTSVKDVAGNSLAADTTYTFTTAAEALTATYSVSGNDYEYLSEAGYTKVGAYINTSSSILKNSRPFKRFVFYLRKKGSPTGTISFDVTNSTGTVKQALGTYSIASLSTSSDTAVTKEITGYTFATNDMVTISYSNGNSSNGLYVKKSNTNATSDSSATCLRKFYYWFGLSNSWSNSTSEDLAAIMYS